MDPRHFPTSARHRQRGLTLVEFMVSIVLGMILVAAIAVLIANQSTARNEIDRGGRLIENGRYAMQVVTDDLMMAGYYGESQNPPVNGTVPGLPATPAATVLPDPCTRTVTSGDAANPGIQESAAFYVQGYDNSTFTGSTLTCTPNWKSGTDVLVVRHADPDTAGITVGTLTDGQVYLQTGLAAATGAAFNYRFYAGDAANNASNFTLVNRGGAVQAPRRWKVHIYYIARCSVCTGTADSIPTLKRVELGAASGAPSLAPTTIAEGIENMQVDYGLDTNAESPGVPDGADVVASAVALANWQAVTSVRVYMLVRSTETAPGYANSKKFAMGASYPASAPLDPGADSYQRHLFQQAVRLVNPVGRLQ